MDIQNAIIESATISSERGILSAWLYLKYNGSGQGFGGYVLYLPQGLTHLANRKNYAGHFIFRCMEIAGVSRWEDLKGRAIRVKGSYGGIESIGHIIKDDWFDPKKDFQE